MYQVDQALVNTFMNGGFALDTAYENEVFVPVQGKPYAEVVVLNNEITPFSVSCSNETGGIFRVILRYPSKSVLAAIDAKKKADEIFNIFKIGKVISYEGVGVTITKQDRYQCTPENAWYKLILSISYKSFLRR